MVVNVRPVKLAASSVFRVHTPLPAVPSHHRHVLPPYRDLGSRLTVHTQLPNGHAAWTRPYGQQMQAEHGSGGSCELVLAESQVSAHEEVVQGGARFVWRVGKRGRLRYLMARIYEFRTRRVGTDVELSEPVEDSTEWRETL